MEIKSPVSATLSPEQLAAIQDAVSHYRAVKGGVMPALHAVQGICGNWLPLEALKLLAEGMDIPYPYLYGVMSFYTMFSPTPRGKYIIRLCESPPCHIMGAVNLAEMLQTELGIKVGETTADGLFTLEHTACLGVCEVSPAMQINEVVFGRLTAERVKNILSDYRAGKAVDYRTLPRTTNPLSDYLASGDELVLLANVDQIDPVEPGRLSGTGRLRRPEKGPDHDFGRGGEHGEGLRPQGPGRRRLPHRAQVVFHPAQPRHPQVHRLQRR